MFIVCKLYIYIYIYIFVSMLGALAMCRLERFHYICIHMYIYIYIYIYNVFPPLFFVTPSTAASRSGIRSRREVPREAFTDVQA